MKKVSAIFFIISFGFALWGQSPQNRFDFEQTTGVPIFQSGDSVLNAWAGGLNYGQVSTLDLNGDNIEDVVIFDRNTRQVSTYLRVGNSYVYDPQYIKFFPKALSWMFLRDYNCDGLKDIFFNEGSDVRVWKNTGSASNMFTPVTNGPLQTIYASSTNTNNLFITAADVPGIADIDNDGDLDIVTFENGGIIMEFHENRANCGLDFKVTERCWGHFTESGLFRSVSLGACTPFKKKGLHTGSTILPLDLNGDGLKDLIMGNVSYNDMIALYNGGSLDSTHFTSQDTLFPTYDKPIDLYQFPVAAYEDVTFDGKPDLLISSADLGDGSKDLNSLILYTNNGTTSTPIFNHTRDDFMQNTMVDIGRGAVPRFVDLNGDSLLDLVVANNEEFITSMLKRHYYQYYVNTGTKLAARFSLLDTNLADISSYTGLEQGTIPTFGDLDGDGDQDMIVGDMDGQLYYFVNNNLTSPSFSFQTALVGLDVDNNAAPFLFDMDNDGDLDLLVGNEAGKVFYYKNSSTTNPNFTLENNNFGGINVKLGGSRGNSVPYAFRNNGDINLFVGSEEFGVYHYDSISKITSLASNLQVTLGTGTVVPGGADQTPFGLINKAGRNQYLYRGSELQAQGLTEGYINSIAFDVTTNNNGILYAKMSVRCKMTNDTALNDFDTGLTELYSSQVNPISQGWTTLNFLNGFWYDGKSSLIIEVCFQESANSNNNATVNMTDMGYNCNVFGQYVDRNTGCDQVKKGVVMRRPNILVNQTPAFTQVGTFGSGLRAAPAVYDLDNDSLFDMIIGTHGGGMYYYEGKPYTVSLPEEPVFSDPNKIGSLNVFPNPGSGSYTITLENESGSSLKVLDLTGRLILERELLEKEVEVNLNDQAKGIYIFMVQTSSGLKTQKVIKQ